MRWAVFDRAIAGRQYPCHRRKDCQILRYIRRALTGLFEVVTAPSDHAESSSVGDNDPADSDVVSLVAGIRDAHRRGDADLRHQLTDALGKLGEAAIL